MRYRRIVASCMVSLLSLYACSPQTSPSKEAEPGVEAPAAASSATATSEPMESQGVSTPVPGESATPLKDVVSAEDLAEYFDEYEFAVALLGDGVSQVAYNEESATRRFSPYSTFKMANALICLEEQVVFAGDSMRRWDGTEYGLSEWNQDQDMASAMKSSCVWYYRQLAREVGKKAMKRRLNELDYGNGDVSGGADEFWLESSLLVSPQEQMDFIIRLYRNELPFSQDNMDYVKSIIRQEDCPVDVYGKTGSSSEGRGWFVGYALLDEAPCFFAAYLEGEGVDGPSVRDKMVELIQERLDGRGTAP